MTENINIKKEHGKTYIFCRIRKKWLILTPEEKVRQFTLQKLIGHYQYPEKFISAEKTLTVHGLRILVECKAPAITLDEKTLKQIAIYNLKLQVPFLMVTNGNQEYYFAIENNATKQINELPLFKP
jgi:YHS domain-containing protein